MTFTDWWNFVGSRIPRFMAEEDHEFEKRIALAAWNAAVEAQAKMADPRDVGRG